jgi:hypothetical protein
MKFFVWWITYGFMKSPIVVQAKDEDSAWKQLLEGNEVAWWVMQGQPEYKLKKFQNNIKQHIVYLKGKPYGINAQRPTVFIKLPVLVPKEVY